MIYKTEGFSDMKSRVKPTEQYLTIMPAQKLQRYINNSCLAINYIIVRHCLGGFYVI